MLYKGKTVFFCSDKETRIIDENGRIKIMKGSSLCIPYSLKEFLIICFPRFLLRHSRKIHPKAWTGKTVPVCSLASCINMVWYGLDRLDDAYRPPREDD
jgi:hypothetical protein